VITGRLATVDAGRRHGIGGGAVITGRLATVDAGRRHGIGGGAVITGRLATVDAGRRHGIGGGAARAIGHTPEGYHPTPTESPKIAA